MGSSGLIDAHLHLRGIGYVVECAPVARVMSTRDVLVSTARTAAEMRNLQARVA